MSEDVSSQVRLGATIILVAALIAAVLSLMVVAQTILTSGLSTLQAGVDQITQQEYEKYNQKKVSGTDVKSAFALYSGKDIAVVIRTKACIEMKYKDANGDYIWGYMYGSLLSPDSSVMPPKIAGSNTVYCVPYTDDEGFTGGTNTIGLKDAISSGVLWKPAGTAYYESYLCTPYDRVEVSYDITGLTKVGDPQYVLDSARFRASLVKATGGNVIGIVFEQLD